jgi:hypothetical protein
VLLPLVEGEGEGFIKGEAKLAKKHDKIEVKHVPTKRQLSRHKRQERIQHIMYISIAAFALLLFGFLGWGLWSTQIKPFQQPAARINDVTYDMRYYVQSLDLYTRNQDPNQIATVANNVINYIQYNQAVIKSAPEFGISATNDEIADALKNAGVPNSPVYRDAAESAILTDKLLQNHFDKEVPYGVEQVDTQALFVESQDIADKVRARAAAGDNFTALVEEYSLEPITKTVSGNLGWLPKDLAYLLLGSVGSSSLKDIPFTLQAGEVSQPTFDGTVTKSLGYWVVQVTETDTTRGNHVRGILTGSSHDAEAIRQKIVDGEDFTELVKSYSQDYESAGLGGDIGWTGEATISNRVVLGMAMALAVGDVSQPAADSNASTVGGFWVVKAAAKDDNRTLDSNTRQTLINALFQNWISEKMRTDTVETLLTDEQKSWAINLVDKKRG